MMSFAMSNNDTKSTGGAPQPSSVYDGGSNTTNGQSSSNKVQSPHNLPSVSLPKGGGAISGIGEKFSVSPATGTGSLSVPIKTSPGRSGSSVQLSLSYDSGSGNGAFGLGWQISNQSITRKTNKGLPQYEDEDESDVFLLSGMEDLVPELNVTSDGKYCRNSETRIINGGNFTVKRYHPRVESGFLKILRFTDTRTKDIHWEVKTDNNVTTIFGESDDYKVFDPLNPSHVFEWLPSRTYDDKGNLTIYEYKREDSSGIIIEETLPEQSRNAIKRTAALYPKRIKYGNTISTLNSKFATDNKWFFEIVFDYGDHDEILPLPQDVRPWLLRSDPFSSRRSGFEIRLYRLCQRVLMFHHFPDEPEVGQDCLVASFNIHYESINLDHATKFSVANVVKSVSQLSYRRKGEEYETQSMPPVEFSYSMAQPAKASKILRPKSLENLPAGFSGDYQIIDLEGQGLAGVVTRIEGSLLYVPNLGDGNFGAAQSLPFVPSAVFRNGKEQWMDMSGGGKIEMVQLNGSPAGYYKRDWNQVSEWDTFRPFGLLPNVDWNSKNLKFLDVTGNGIADIVILDDQLVTICRGLGDVGFDEPSFTSPPLEDVHSSGGRLLFWDGLEAIYTADMTGDGLSDLVRIRNREVCYWPNLGYGKFDTKVVMAGAPTFDTAELFDQAYIRLSDVDGSGTTDIIYLGSDIPMIYHNLSGNALSKGIPITGFPGIDATSDVQVVDLLGRGTACLVWSSILPGDFGRHIRYLDLMEGGKPYLLVKMENNLGWESRLTYASSCQFYAADKKAGRPWTSHLPFPMHCVERSEAVDRVSKNLYTTRYAYHDGYYDPDEREFRGFGMVETWDTEVYSTFEQESYSNINKLSDAPPMLTKTWYSTGEYLDGRAVNWYPDVPFWTESGISNSQPGDLPETELPSSITMEEAVISYSPSHQEKREACRALRGSVVRSEIYALDGTTLQDIPYSIKQSNMTIEQRQPLGSNRHAVFFVRPKETLELLYERKLYKSQAGRPHFDPRVSHTLVLEIDFWGNPLKSMNVSYGRRLREPDKRLTEEDRAAQSRTWAGLAEATPTNSIDTCDTYLLPKPSDSRTYEVINMDACRPSARTIDGLNLVSFGEAVRISKVLSTGKFDVPYENFIGPYPSTNTVYRRLLKEGCTIYRSDNLKHQLPIGVVESLAIPWQSFKLEFTEDQALHYAKAGKIPADELEETLRELCNLVRIPGRAGWWSPSGQAFFTRDRDTDAEEELRQAKDHFFITQRSRPPYDRQDSPSEAFYNYDSYDLLIQEVEDAYGNRLTVGERNSNPLLPLVKNGYNYRLLKPFFIMDANRNCSDVLFDIMGNVVASAAMGNPGGQLGDSIEGMKSMLNCAETEKFFENPTSSYSKALIGTATSRIVYDMFAYYRTRHHNHPQPNWASTLTRETHVSDLPARTESRVFVSLLFSDGSGRSVQAKMQAEPGPLSPDDPSGSSVPDRWLTSSWTIFNNKNKPVRQYEPFFSDSHRFEFEATHGVSSIMLYDPIGRPIATISPDHTWTKVSFDPWGTTQWDKGDTVLISDPSKDVDVGSFIKRLPKEDYLPTWYEQRCSGQLGPHEKAAAKQATISANSPTHSFYDSMGRNRVSFDVLREPPSSDHGLSLSRVDQVIRQVSYIDIQGLPVKTTDPLGRVISRAIYKIGGATLSETHMDNGTKWILQDSAENPIYNWNSQGDRYRSVYDRSRRIVGLYFEQDGKECLVEKSIYGETQPNTEQENARGRIVSAFDQSGITQTPRYDFQGNMIGSRRQLSKDYKNIIDWSTQDTEVETRSYDEAITYNSLGKPTQTTLPDGTTTSYCYNERGLTKSVATTLSGTNNASEVIQDIEYDAKGQRIRVIHGNGVQTTSTYDKNTFRIVRILTVRTHGDSSDSEDNTTAKKEQGRSRAKKHLQDLRYVYDASGNITNIEDQAAKTTFFRNKKIDASQSFVYDSLSRLVEATGREHLGQMHASNDRHTSQQITGPATDGRFDHPNDSKAVGQYVERYSYDSVNNLLTMRHFNFTESRGWTRKYFYEENSLVCPDEVNNRLSRTSVGDIVEEYRYGGPENQRGNMTSMPGLPHMTYDYGERMSSSVQTVGKGGTSREITYYCYDATGKRVRKLTERLGESQETSKVLKETIYIGGAYEVFRRYDGSGDVVLELDSINIIESGRRLLLIEHRTVGGHDRTPSILYRYQLGNHQGSAAVEVDQNARLISYEEYTPYGVSSYRAMYRDIETPKRYRFLGKERDETGLYHFGLRYYASWLGRFVSADPKGAVDGPNLYHYAQGNPVMLSDPGGTAAAPSAPPPTGALGWDFNAIRSRARDWIVFENLPSWVSGIREWRVYGRMAAGDFAYMLQNQFLAEGKSAADAFVKLEQYMPNAETGGRLGSSFIDFMFPALKQAYEHKLMDFGKYADEGGNLVASELKSVFSGADGYLAQLDKHTTNIAAELGEGWGKTRLAVTIRGVAEGSEEFSQMAGKIQEILKDAGQLEALIVHADNPAIMAARRSLDSAAVGLINKAGGLAKFIGAGAEFLGPAAAALTMFAMPSQAEAATNKALPKSSRLQAGLDLGSGVTSLGVTAVAGAVKAGTLATAGAAATGAAAAVVVAGAALGGAAAGALVGGYVSDKVEHSEWVKSKLGEDGAAEAGAATGVLAGAAAGAAVGALVGSVLPVVGTAAGAAIGAVAGAAAAGAKILISKYWG